MLANIIHDLRLKELEINTVVKERDNLKSLLEEVTLKFENLKLASSERELALEIQLSKLKEDYKNDKLSANNQIEEIEGKLKVVTKRNIELLNENLEISTKLKESEEIRTNVVQTAKPVTEMNGQLIDFVNVDSTLAEMESYENGEEIHLEQVSTSTARSASPPFTRRTPPPRHYRSKRNSKRKINSDTCSWLDDDQIDGHKEAREKMNEIGLPMVPSPTTRDTLMDKLVGQSALSEAQRPEAESVEWGHPCPTSGLRVGGWFC